MNKRIIFIFFILMFSNLVIITQVEQNIVKGFSGSGSGTPADPYQIINASTLNETRDELDAYYILMNDIDLSGCDGWNGGEGFIPIGNETSPFTGVFDGDGYNITNFFIDNDSMLWVGLFGYVNGGVIHNLSLSVNVTGDDYVGGLAGVLATGSSINDCTMSGNVTGDEGVGGLAGDLDGVGNSINGCTISVNVTGDDYVGGLAGVLDGAGSSINDCTISGNVTGDERVGGLASVLDGAGSSINNCTISVNVTGTSDVGGLVGYVDSVGGSINDCTMSGNVTGDEGVGGLVGYVDEAGSSINGCTISVNVTGDDYVGGLVGYVDGAGNSINDCTISGDVTGDGDYVGGLIGRVQAGTIDNSSSSCEVINNDAVDGDYTGGLIGYIHSELPGTVSCCYATGDVTGNNYTGGLIGRSYDSVYNCYARGDVTGNNYVGGFIGYNTYNISKCYSTGLVSGNTHVGGFAAGAEVSSINYCYWDNVTSGQTSSNGGTGRTTSQMTYDYVGYTPPCSGLYETWDLGYAGDNMIWAHDVTGSLNDGYPLFNNQPNITLNVYNESNTSQGLTFNVFVTNSVGSETFYDETCTNPYNVYYNLIPTGNKISFLISSTGYYSRQFFMDIDVRIHYNINVYLSPQNANLYFMNVINEYNEPVEDVKLTVKRYINDSSGFEDMTSLYTDGGGQCSAYLLPGVQYKVALNKSGYVDKTDDFIPDPTYYGIGYPKYFKIYFLEHTYTNETMYHECITFNGNMSSGNIYVNYTDSCNETQNITITVYEINGSTGDESEFDDYMVNDTDGIQHIFTDANMSNCYRVEIMVNHTYFGTYYDSFILCNTTTTTNKTFFDDLFELNYGTSPGGFGWSNILGFIILVSGMFSFGQQGSGIAMVVTGFLLLFVNSYIGLTFISILATSILIVFGILVIWANQRRIIG